MRAALLCGEPSIDVWQTLRPLLKQQAHRQLNDCLLMQCTERPRDTERGDGSTSATAERGSSLRLPRLQHAVRALRPNRETDPERSPDWRSIARAPPADAFASCRLTTNSNLVGCSTGRSAGFAPRSQNRTHAPYRSADTISCEPAWE
jgi:hypothetical protein